MSTTFVIRSLVALLISYCYVSIAMAEDSGSQPSVNNGAKVFVERCVLCHGAQGMGEGNLPLKLKDYPSTNLLRNTKTQDYQQVYDAVTIGGSTTQTQLSNLMPPMGNELTWTDAESVVRFVMLLRENTAEAQAMLNQEKAGIQPSLKLGRQIFSNRCVLCHGPYGEGDGRMARIIKSPPPYNLTLSVVPGDYVRKIIASGGEGAGRSPQMPPWSDQLNSAEIDSVTQYLMSIRKYK